MTENAIVARLRAQGERITVQRTMVIDALCEADEHLTVQDVQHVVEARGVALTEPTVYRILQWLKDLNLISQTDLGQRGVAYELIGERPHHHLVCLHCGAVINLDDAVFDDLRAHLRRAHHFAPRIDHMAIFGTCPACQQTADTRPAE